MTSHTNLVISIPAILMRQLKLNLPINIGNVQIRMSDSRIVELFMTPDPPTVRDVSTSLLTDPHSILRGMQPSPPTKASSSGGVTPPDAQLPEDFALNEKASSAPTSRRK